MDNHYIIIFFLNTDTDKNNIIWFFLDIDTATDKNNTTLIFWIRIRIRIKMISFRYFWIRMRLKKVIIIFLDIDTGENNIILTILSMVTDKKISF